MLKATKIHALAIDLVDGDRAILVEDGPPWNTLQKFKCVSPPALAGQNLVASRDMEDKPFNALFNAVFKLGVEEEKWIVVMASPDLAARLKHVGGEEG